MPSARDVHRRELGFKCEDITGDARIVEAYEDFRGPVVLARMTIPAGDLGKAQGGTAGDGADFEPMDAKL